MLKKIFKSIGIVIAVMIIFLAVAFFLDKEWLLSKFIPATVTFIKTIK